MKNDDIITTELVPRIMDFITVEHAEIVSNYHITWK